MATARATHRHHTRDSQDWIIQHLFALGLRLELAAARADIRAAREDIEAVADGLDEVIATVRRAA